MQSMYLIAFLLEEVVQHPDSFYITQKTQLSKELMLSSQSSSSFNDPEYEHRFIVDDYADASVSNIRFLTNRQQQKKSISV